MKYPLIAFAVLLVGCGKEPERKPTRTESKPVAVRTETVSITDWPTIYEATGTVRARTTATISSRWMASVREVKVQAGDRVREGQTLVVLDSRDLEAGTRRADAARAEVKSGIPEADSGVVAAQASLDLAQTTFGRMQDLFQKKSISNQEFDEASARLKAARAALDMAKARRGQLNARLAQAEQEVRSAEINRTYSEIASPFSGVVTAKTVDPGAMAVPGAPLLTIERDGAFRLEASVEESRLSSIRVGQQVGVAIDGVEQTITARVSEIVPAIDAAARSGIVKIDLPGIRGLRSGQFGRATFTSGNRRVIEIPVNAVAERGQLQSVLVVDNGIARLRLVTLGETRGNRREVLSGLSENDRVVAPIPSSLTDGAPVEVSK